MIATSFQPLTRLNELPTENGAIDLTKLVQIPGGGTHNIYRLNEHSSFLLKVVKDSVGKDQETLERKFADLNDKYSKLYPIFGEQRCLVETRSIQKVLDGNTSTEQNAIVSLVAYDNCFHSDEKFGFNTETVEAQEPKLRANLQKYHLLNQSLLGAEQSDKPYNEEDFLLFHSSFRPMFNLLDKDESLREVVTEFLLKFKAYYTKTEQLMDLTGIDNVLFYKDQNGWQYKVGSVIKVETREKAMKLFRELDNNPSIVNDSLENWTHLFFVPSWVRTLNATAAKLGMDKIVDNITLSQKDSENLSKLHETQPKNVRAVQCAEFNEFETALEFYKEYQIVEKDHDSWGRHMMGKLYATAIQQQGLRRSEHEILAYLNLLIDPMNDLPKAKWKEVQAAIEELKTQLEKYDPIESTILDKIESTLYKMGYVNRLKELLATPTPKDDFIIDSKKDPIMFSQDITQKKNTSTLTVESLNLEEEKKRLILDI